MRPCARHRAPLLAAEVALVTAACALSLSLALTLGPAAAWAAEPTPPAARAASVWSPELILTTGRFGFPAPDPNGVNLGTHGEYQLRILGATDLPLDPPIRERTGEASELGQNFRVEHWLRLRSRIDLEDTLSLVLEGDIPRGYVAGDDTRFVSAARDSFDDPAPFELHPRQLYVEVRTPIGLVRVGQQTSSWGMGLLANDGNTPEMFGDYRRGDLTERLLFATRPAGKDHPLVIAVAGDIVFEDDTADLIDEGDLVTQGVLAIAWRDREFDLGAYGVLRRHERQESSVVVSRGYTEELTVAVLDLAGGFHQGVPGARGYIYGQFEAAAIFGSTDFVRTSWSQVVDPTEASQTREDIFQLGGAAKLGFVHLSHAPRDRVMPNGAVVDPPGREGEPWGDVVGEVETGFASGDADPADGESRRFVFDGNHNVGLVLFDHVLAWKTARAATNAQDPRLVGRAPPGIDLLASDGGVFGATYVNPRFIGRPARWLDLKLGVVIAQATSDVVDPYRFGAQGSARNWDGGDPDARDLGVEVDAGVEVRIPIGKDAVAQIGAEGGVLAPGGAFDDAAGQRLPVQALGQGRLGLQF